MRHIIHANTPHIIQRYNPVSGQWQGIAYAANVRQTDQKIAELMRFHSAKGVKYRAIPK